MSLVKQNADVGADIANSIVDLLTKDTAKSQKPQMSQPRSRVVCVGGSVIDTIAKSSPSFIAGTSNPGVIHRSGKCSRIQIFACMRCWVIASHFLCAGLYLARWWRRAKHCRGSRAAWIEAFFLHGHRRQNRWWTRDDIAFGKRVWSDDIVKECTRRYRFGYGTVSSAVGQ